MTNCQHALIAVFLLPASCLKAASPEPDPRNLADVVVPVKGEARSMPIPASISPEPTRIGLDPAMTNEQLVTLARQQAKAIQSDENNGKHHMLLADALVELASRVKDLSPLTHRIEPNPDLSEKRNLEIISNVNVLCTHYDGVQALVWLVEQGDEAEPFVVERLQKARDYEQPRLQRVLSTHWKNLAIEHYAQAHNLAWRQDIDSYNPSFGEPWDKFTALRSGKIYLQMTAWRTDEETQQQAARVRATFAALSKKQNEYRGPVR